MTFTLVPVLEPISGDITGDRQINLYDVIEIAKYILGMREFNSVESVIADYNVDGNVNIYDAIEIAKKLLE